MCIFAVHCIPINGCENTQRYCCYPHHRAESADYQLKRGVDAASLPASATCRSRASAAGSPYAAQLAFSCDALVIFESAFDRVLKFSVRRRQPPCDLVGTRWRAGSNSRFGMKIDELTNLKIMVGHRRASWQLISAPQSRSPQWRYRPQEPSACLGGITKYVIPQRA